MDVEELVGVEHHRPIHFAKHRQFLDAGISGQLCLVPRANLIDQMRDNPQLLETVQQRRRPVDAVIRADNNVGEPGRQMVGHPFQNVGPFIAHRGGEQYPGSDPVCRHGEQRSHRRR